jgi:Zn-dependent protease
MTTEPQAAPAAPTHGYGPALVMVFVVLVLGAALVILPSPPAVLTFAFVMVGWIVSVVAHEFGHAWVAHLAGDTTVAAKGYLSLDPRKYGDLGTTLVIPLLALALGGIGFPGGAVYLRPDLMRSPVWRSAASLAGPAGTLAVLALLAAVLAVVHAVMPPDNAFANALAFLAFLQGTALVLNLLPLPGLDGYGAIRPFLPPAVIKALAPVERWAILLLLALIFLVPGGTGGLFRAGLALTNLFGVPITEVGGGYVAFRFWEAAP